MFGPPLWGIYDQDGNPIISVDSASDVEADSVAAFEYARDYRISNYPQEQGAFESYNKVQVPFRAIVSFFVGAARFNFLANIEQAVASLDLYAVFTPEWSYPNANLTHYSYSRDVRQGATLLRIDVWLEEVRIALVSPGATTGSINQGNAQSTNAAAPASSGTVQAVPASSVLPGGVVGTVPGPPIG